MTRTCDSSLNQLTGRAREFDQIMSTSRVKGDGSAPWVDAGTAMDPRLVTIIYG